MPLTRVLSNAHCHTTWCDGANSPEEMIQAALELGFVSLGFSVHGWTPYEPCGITIEREELYRQELRALREKYRGQIEIIIGAERDSLYKRDFSKFEYVIESTHGMYGRDGEFFFVDWSRDRTEKFVRENFGGNYYDYAAAYYRQVAQAASGSDGLFLGHIDLLTKFNEGNCLFDENDPRYLKCAFEAAETAIRRGMPLEMNTGAISRGYRATPYPNMSILKFIREQGGEIMINSDAHCVAGMAMGFDACLEMARAAGFDHILYLREKGLEEIGIL